jgi:methionyl-tRNA synthetase
MTTIRLANLYVEETKPWVLAKKSPSDPTLLAMLSLVFETLRVTSIMMWPVIPNLSQMILGKILNVKIYCCKPLLEAVAVMTLYSYRCIDRLNVNAEDRNWDSIRPYSWESNDQKEDSLLGGNHTIIYRRIKQ